LIFNDLQTTDIPEARTPNPDPLSLLIATHWLKAYPKKAQIAGTFKVDEKTARKYIWKYVQAIAALKGIKVRFRGNCKGGQRAHKDQEEKKLKVQELSI
jgi:hypothetical protein